MSQDDSRRLAIIQLEGPLRPFFLEAAQSQKLSLLEAETPAYRFPFKENFRARTLGHAGGGIQLRARLCQASRKIAEKSSKLVPLGAPPFPPFPFRDFQHHPYCHFELVR